MPALKAVVLDVDGTLYRQGPLRRAMLVRLLSAHAVRPAAAWRTFTSLRAYRRAQEDLRDCAEGDMAAAQLRLACERAGLDHATVSGCVERWMEREPLPLLGRCLQPGLVEFLEACRVRGLRLATLSDYPADAKLDALGVSGYFDLSLSAQAREVGAFKPNPRGLHVALGRLGVEPEEAVYVGDRADVDAVAARAAGVACAILAPRHAEPTTASYVAVESFYHLRDLLLAPPAADRAVA